MDNNLPAAAVGHFIMKVSDINISYQFYTERACVHAGLRGGSHILFFSKSHILFFSKDDELPFSLTSSHLGQRSAFLVNDST
jgi:hypothetical protein